MPAPARHPFIWIAPLDTDMTQSSVRIVTNLHDEPQSVHRRTDTKQARHKQFEIYQYEAPP